MFALLILRLITGHIEGPVFCFQNLVFVVKRAVLFTIVYICGVVDLKKGIIPDSLIVSGAVSASVFIMAEIYLRGLLAGLVFLGGSVLICLFLLLVSVLQKGRLGGGDIKLFTVISMFMGFRDTLMCILIACIIGLVIFGVMFVVKKRVKSMPLGPATVLAVLIILC